MKRLFPFAWISLCCTLVLSSFSTEYDDPDGKAGASGAPGETTCNDTDCHNSFALNSGSGSISIASPDLTDWAYVPGTTYTISVTVAQSSINLFGLCFEALKPNGDNAGTLHTGAGTQIKNKTVGGFQRKSITHNNNTGASANSHTFTFTWTAPTTDIGTITFYVAGLAANGDDHESNDRVYSTSQQVTAASVGLIEILNNGDRMHVYPNPASSKIQFNLSDVSSLAEEAIVLDNLGKTVARFPKNTWGISGNTGLLNIDNLSGGNFTLCFTSKGRVIEHCNFIKE